MTNTEKEIESLVREFATKLVEMTETSVRQRAFEAVAGAMAGVADVRGGAVGAPAAAPIRRTLRLSSKGLAARKLQGQYLGLLRGPSAGNRIRVKKVAREDGVAAAVKFGRTLK